MQQLNNIENTVEVMGYNNSQIKILLRIRFVLRLYSAVKLGFIRWYKGIYNLIFRHTTEERRFSLY